VARICGFHHVSLPARDLDRSSDWYERVFGFERILIEEDEACVTMIMLEHPEGMVLCLHTAPDPAPRRELGNSVALLSFRVASRADLTAWDRRLTGLGVEHSSPHPAHLGWALNVADPSGLRIQLHTRETITADDA